MDRKLSTFGRAYTQESSINYCGTFLCGQVNKNWLAKVLVGSDAAVAALAFKAWWQPSFTLAANAGAPEVHVWFFSYKQ